MRASMNHTLTSYQTELQERLRRRVKDLRFHRRQKLSAQARWVERDTYCLRGTEYSRLRIILVGNGCSRPHCTMCPLPNESISRSLNDASTTSAVDQVTRALSNLHGSEMVCIYNDGSFFSPVELHSDARHAIYELVRKSGARILMVESLPEFLTRTVVQEAVTVLGPSVQLVVGIGLQSSDHIVRELCIASSVTERVFRNGMHLLDSLGVGAKVYLMFKPPFLTETEAQADLMQSIEWLTYFHPVDITVCPTRIAEGTVAHDLHSSGMYVQPALGSVVSALSYLSQSSVDVRVSLFNVASSDFPSLTPRICSSCGPELLRRLAGSSRSLQFDGYSWNCPTCTSHLTAERSMEYFSLPLEQRIEVYLKSTLESFCPSILQQERSSTQ